MELFFNSDSDSNFPRFGFKHARDACSALYATDPAVLRLREGARLNRAVNALAGVIRALATQRREFAGHGDSVLTKVLAEPLGGNCATTVLATLRLGEWERSAAVMDLVGHARRAPTFPVVGWYKLGTHHSTRELESLLVSNR